MISITSISLHFVLKSCNILCSGKRVSEKIYDTSIYDSSNVHRILSKNPYIFCKFLTLIIVYEYVILAYFI